MTKHQFLNGHQFFATTQETRYMFRKSNIAGVGMVMVFNCGQWSYSCTVSKVTDTHLHAFTSILGAPVTLVISFNSLTCLTCQGGACKP